MADNRYILQQLKRNANAQFSNVLTKIHVSLNSFEKLQIAFLALISGVFFATAVGVSAYVFNAQFKYAASLSTLWLFAIFCGAMTAAMTYPIYRKLKLIAKTFAAKSQAIQRKNAETYDQLKTSLTNRSLAMLQVAILQNTPNTSPQFNLENMIEQSILDDKIKNEIWVSLNEKINAFYVDFAKNHPELIGELTQNPNPQLIHTMLSHNPDIQLFLEKEIPATLEQSIVPNEDNYPKTSSLLRTLAFTFLTTLSLGLMATVGMAAFMLSGIAALTASGIFLTLGSVFLGSSLLAGFAISAVMGYFANSAASNENDFAKRFLENNFLNHFSEKFLPQSKDFAKKLKEVLLLSHANTKHAASQTLEHPDLHTKATFFNKPITSNTADVKEEKQSQVDYSRRKLS